MIEDTLSQLIAMAWLEVIAQREEILRAFIAKTDFQPDEIEQVQQQTPTGWQWYVRRKAFSGAVRP